MRSAFAHVATAELDGVTSDARALGGAVTVELCGHWDHAGACRWPHHVRVVAHDGPRVTVRVVFACEAGEERDVRARIVAALRSGACRGPDGAVSRWSVIHDGASELREDEGEVAAGLTGR